MTGARYGLIATVDEAGEVPDAVSSGLTPEERRWLVDWPRGPELFARLRDLPGPLRLADRPGYVLSFGSSPDITLSNTLQAAPMRRRGVHVGSLFLGEKESRREFTHDDKELPLLFASQGAIAISNVRTHRARQWARADLDSDAVYDFSKYVRYCFIPIFVVMFFLCKQSGSELG